jgi:hypothetical protein
MLIIVPRGRQVNRAGEKTASSPYRASGVAGPRQMLPPKVLT